MAKRWVGVRERCAGMRFAAAFLILTGAASVAEANVFSQNYVVIGWSDLGMYRIQKDQAALCLAPPSSNFFAQVVQRGNPPVLVKTGVTLSYSIPGQHDQLHQGQLLDVRQQFVRGFRRP